MSYANAKRLFDVVCASLGLVLLAPLGLLIVLLIKCAGGGPVLYGQSRVGQFGKPFRIWKFRSMIVNAEQSGGSLTSEDDPRITRLGRLLRKAKLDELPQLWNVLVGEMSFVGPRPEVRHYVDLYTPEQAKILNYKPGITDMSSLLFRHEEKLLKGAGNVEGFYLRYCLPKKIELNRQYAERATLLQDIWIILQTLVPYWFAVLVVYFISLAFSFGLAYELKSDFRPSRQDYEELKHFLPLIVLPQIIFLVWRGQLRGLLSYFSIPELRKTVIALAAAFAVQIGLCYSIQRRMEPRPSILLMDFILSFFTLCGVRMAFRLLREQNCRTGPDLQVSSRRVALIGTGELATNLLLDFARSETPTRRVVAFFDDNPYTWHKRPHDIPVVGMPECLLNREWFERIDEVIITLPEKDSARIREIGDMLKGLPLTVTVASGWPVLKAL
jgi:lipopolysaccharide/colanic/teichoic acid biosynthesis glycosyltransferase